MNIILDTHAFLWFSEDNPQLSATAKSMIENGDNNCYVSMASIWEMAVKISIGKLKISFPFRNMVQEINRNGFDVLPILFEHTNELISLDFYHRDPFDRLIIAQAMAENLHIVSADATFDKYPIKRIW